MKRRCSFLICWLALALSSLSVWAGVTPGEVEVGSTLQDATMAGLNGAPKRLSSYKGKPLIINVWASWCGPCRQEMASLERLAWRDPKAPFTVIGISTDDDADAAKALLKRTNATISHFIDQQLQMEHMLGATHLPLTVLVDARGRVLHKVFGAKEWDSPESLKMISDTFGPTPNSTPTHNTPSRTQANTNKHTVP